MYFFFSELLQIQRDLSNVNSELKSLQDTYNNKTDAWIKEKIDLQVRNFIVLYFMKIEKESISIFMIVKLCRRSYQV